MLFDARDASGFDVERLHANRREQLVRDEIAVMRPEPRERDGERTAAPPDSRVRGPGVLRLEIRIRQDPALIEIQLRQRGWPEGKPCSGAQLDRSESTAVERRPRCRDS